MSDLAERADDPNLRHLVWTAAIVGLILFAALTFLLGYFGNRPAVAAPLIDVYKTLAAIVLSFSGGVHWGLALGKFDGIISGWKTAAATIAPLTGWVAIFLFEPLCFALLAVAFAGQGSLDNFTAHGGLLPHWYSRMRMQMTIIVVALLAIAMFITA